MRIPLLVTSVLISLPLFGQIKSESFNAVNNTDPLYIFAETTQSEETQYLLEKKDYITPDEYSDNPIGLSLTNFKKIQLEDTKNNCSFFKAKDDNFVSFLNSNFSNAPELSFFEDRLYRIKFHFNTEDISTKGDLYKSLINKFGKPEKNKYNISDNTVREYLWKGYKINISLLYFDSKTSREQIIIIEDDLIGKLAIADQENKTYVKEEKLYSDIETLFRYK
ncbi:hypothetical protein [Chondrinema litorale]|uniref:hypothetical protein n=1 Tax=Chondrinema litorale TaxID=2994555 RepID=UPI002543D038|nr:hypothetical protein [Chondrinema litorale]UZR92983.1 hypothetical protein OQ292_14070 [Chondrinema litorale]